MPIVKESFRDNCGVSLALAQPDLMKVGGHISGMFVRQCFTCVTMRVPVRLISMFRANSETGWCMSGP